MWRGSRFDGYTRRGCLALLSSLLPAQTTGKGKTFPLEAAVYLDPATEFRVERLTDPQYSSLLPYPYCRFIARRGLSFLMTSDRGDGNQVHRYELRSGEIRQLTSASALAPRAVNLTPDDRAFLFLDGPSLRISTLSGLREREIYRIPDGWQLGEGFCLSGDGIYAVLIETSGTRHRLRLIGVARGDAVTVVEAEVPLRHPRPRPRRAGILYERDGHLQVVSYDGKSDRKLFPVVNSPGAAHWSPDGRSVLYLQAQGRAVSLRECTPDTMQDRHVAPTTQFGSFGQNSDASVFLGASSSVASPFVLLLLRAARRELTLCEHKASDPLMVAPVFSPTSQRVYFQSDRHGKPAIYSVVVDKFIEKTESDEELKPPEVKKTGLEDV